MYKNEVYQYGKLCDVFTVCVDNRERDYPYERFEFGCRFYTVVKATSCELRASSEYLLFRRVINALLQWEINVTHFDKICKL